MTRAARRHLSLLAFVATSTALGPQLGCQELLGIEPWASAGGGGAASSASGEVVASSDSATASSTTTEPASSSSGSQCPVDCMGGECMGMTCQPYDHAIESIEDGHLAVLGDSVVAAWRPAGGGAPKLVRVAKAAAHGEMFYVANATTVEALTTTADGYVYWASPSSIHRLSGAGVEANLTAVGQMDTANITDLTTATISGAALVCFLNAKAGVYCQSRLRADTPIQILQLVNPLGLASDGAQVFSITNANTSGGTIFRYDGATGVIARDAPFATSVHRHAAGLYWLASDSVHRVDVASSVNAEELSSPVGGDALRILGRGSFVYVLSAKGIERFDATTLEQDQAFVLGVGNVPLDFAIDDEGIYWLSGGIQESRIGFLALPLETP